MNRILATVIVLLMAGAIILGGFLFNTHTIRQTDQSLDHALLLSSSDNIQNTIREISAICQNWEKNMNIMLMFSSHDKPDQIEESLNIALIYIRCGDINMFTAECHRAKILLSHLYSLEFPSVTNIL